MSNNWAIYSNHKICYKFYYALYIFLTKARCLHSIAFPYTFIHSIGMCRMWRFLAVLRSFFHSSLVCTFSCHPSPPTILPSSLTSSYHLFLGLPLNLAVPKFIYNTLLGILLSFILCTSPNQRNLFTLVNIKYSTSLHKRHGQHTWCQMTYHSLHRIFNTSVKKPYIMFWNPEILNTPMARALLPSRRKQNPLCNEL